MIRTVLDLAIDFAFVGALLCGTALIYVLSN